MTLIEFYRATAGMPGSTPILVLDPWGELNPAVIVTIEDLVPGDPLIEEMPATGLVLTAEPDNED